MTILSRYILREILHYFWVFLLAMMAVFVIYQIHDTKSEILDNQSGLKNVVLFLLFTIPGNLREALPFVCWLSTCFAYGILAKNKEILAMAAAGVSFPALARPAIQFGVVSTVLFFVFNQTVVPYTQEKARQFEKGGLAGREAAVNAQVKNLFVKGVGNRFYIIEKYDGAAHTMEFPTIIEVNAGGDVITERLQAVSGRTIEGDDKGLNWQFEGAERWKFTDGANLASYQTFAQPLQVSLEESLDRFLAKEKRTEDMNLRELVEARKLKIARGQTDYKKYSFEIHSAVALPVSCLILALVGFVVVTDVKSRKLVHLGTIGLLMATGFYVLNVVGRKAGDNGYVPASAAAWFATVVYAVVIVLMFRRLNTIR